MVDFSKLTNAEVDALTGHRREAWYAWRRGDEDRAHRIIETYESRPISVTRTQPVRPQEAADGPAPTVETADAPRARTRARKTGGGR